MQAAFKLVSVHLGEEKDQSLLPVSECPAQRGTRRGEKRSLKIRLATFCDTSKVLVRHPAQKIEKLPLCDDSMSVRTAETTRDCVTFRVTF